MADNPQASGHDPNVDRSLLHSIAWTGAVKWGAQIFTWASTLLVARVLDLADYGVFSLAIVYVGLVAIIGEYGLGAAIVTMRDLSEDAIAQLHGASILFGATAMLVSCALAWPIGWFYNEMKDVTWVVLAMSTGLLIQSLRTIPGALMRRDLEFKRLGLIEFMQTLSIAMLTLTLAVLGARYWSLVAGSIVGGVAATTAILIRRRQRAAWPHLDVIREPIRYGARILSGAFSWYIYSSADLIVAGKMLGKEMAGAYGMAFQIASVPVEKMTNIVTRVTPAYFSALQKDTPGLRRQLLLLTEGITMLTLPASVGMALVADDFVVAALGVKWVDAIVPLQLLSLYASVRSVTTLLPQVLNVRGHSLIVARMGVVYVLVLPAAFVLGSRWGVAGIAAVWTIVYPLLTIPLFLRTFETLEMRARDYFAAVWVPVRGTLAMAAAVLAVSLPLQSVESVWVSLIAKVLVGALAYGLTAVLPERERFLTIFRRLAGKGTAPA